MYRVDATEGVSRADLGAALGERLGPEVRVEVLDTGIEDLEPLMVVLRLIAVVLVGAASGAALGLVATVVGVPLGPWIFRAMSDVVSTGLGVGPGWMPAPDPLAAAVVVVGAVVLSASLSALAVARIARRPASDLVRGE